MRERPLLAGSFGERFSQCPENAALLSGLPSLDFGDFSNQNMEKHFHRFPSCCKVSSFYMSFVHESKYQCFQCMDTFDTFLRIFHTPAIEAANESLDTLLLIVYWKS